jgi:magnesium chelatase subunit D
VVKAARSVVRAAVTDPDVIAARVAEAAQMEADGDREIESAGVRQAYPLAAVVGQENIKSALLLGAIDPNLGGIAISGRRGTAKSIMARGLHALLPPIEVVDGTFCNSDPENPNSWEDGLREKLSRDAKGDVVTRIREAPFVQVPLGVTEDRLVGTVDIEASMKEGKTVFQPGLLAEAHRGILYVDEINLLDESVSNLLLTVLAEGENVVEREGITLRHPCKPLLIATFNPEEGGLREHLLDRIAVTLSADQVLTFDDRVEAVTQAMNFQNSADNAVKKAEEATEGARTQIILAREWLKECEISEEQIGYLVGEATRGICMGHRAELFAVKAAKALAALDGRSKVNADDLKQAVRLVIIPRAKSDMDVPPPDEDEEQQPRPRPLPPRTTWRTTRRTRTRRITKRRRRRRMTRSPTSPRSSCSTPRAAWTTRRCSSLPRRLPAVAAPVAPRASSSPTTAAGTSSPSCPRVTSCASLRTAAPYQKARRDRAIAAGEVPKKVYVEKSDMRAKKLARKSGALIVFLVDASGSMALNRMNAAKGAALSLLEDAYQSRDMVSIIPFRGDAAEVLLPPSRSIAMARNRLDTMPCGGGSPLAHGLSLAARVGINAMSSGDVGRVMVVCLTDGRANISINKSLEDPDYLGPDAIKPSADELQEEVDDMAGRLYSAGMNLLVIDTENKFVSSGTAEKLAQKALGKYYYLPNGTDREIAAATSSALADAKTD